MIGAVRPETKVNLWFLVIFLVISVPGAVILFRKKLDPSASRMDQPDAIVRALPYMTPPPWPPGMRWIVPPSTKHWVDAIARLHGGEDQAESAVRGGPEWVPVISQDHLLQLVTHHVGKNSSTFGLLVWSDSLPLDRAVYRVTCGRFKLDVTGVSRISVPSDVRHELVTLGFSRPPENVTWIEATLGSVLELGPQTLTFDCVATQPPLHTSVQFEDLSDSPSTEPTTHDSR